MNKETYEALERVINQIGGGYDDVFYRDWRNVKDWIDEVAKEYVECKNKDSNGNSCFDCENGGICGETKDN